MNDRLERFEMLVGKENVNLLSEKKVIVFGIGGVGGYVCEALARSGVGTIDLVDNDTVSPTNINRQIIALTSTVGKYKTQVMHDRIKDINPDINCRIYNIFYLPENADSIDLSKYDYAVDAIDTVSGKMEIVKRCTALKIPVISSMGTGNKFDPSKITVTDIYKTKVCPLARVMRGLCKKEGIKKLAVVYSEEQPKTPLFQPEAQNGQRKNIPSSSAFVPPVAGLTIASQVIEGLLKMC